ncbi:hypothetical protein HF878_05910 [Selenomonas bovis]|uniref:Uncharacterized protein n=1 Tax=Selenomonas bovis TaxID=416586 RepID=A0A848BAS5_9FIRM|nr:hypothetical protein [Selenomonas bovis]NMD99015.1 hypothetical protein [Selenomonas bovis]
MRRFDIRRRGRQQRAVLSGALAALPAGLMAALAAELAAEAGAYFPAVYALTLALCLAGTALLARRGLPLVLAPDLGTACWLIYLIVISHGVTLPLLYACLAAAAALVWLLLRCGAAGRALSAFPPCLRAALPLSLGLLLFLWGAEQGRLLLASPLHLVMLGDFADPLAYFTLLGLLALLGLRALRLPPLAAVLGAFLVTALLSLAEGFWIVPPAPFYLPEGLDRAAGLFLRAGEGEVAALTGAAAAFPWLVAVLLLTSWGTIAALFPRLGRGDGAASGGVSAASEKAGLRGVLAALVAVNVLAALAGVLPLMASRLSALAGREGARRPRAFACGACAIFALLLFAAPLARELVSFPAALALLALAAGLSLLRRARLPRLRLVEERAAVLSLVLIVPLTYDIALGLSLSLIAYVLLRQLARRPVPFATRGLAALFVLLAVFAAWIF